MQALRRAVAIGKADIKAGRYVSFNAPASLRAHIDSLANRENSGSSACRMSLASNSATRKRNGL